MAIFVNMFEKNSTKIGMDNSSMKTNDTNKGTIDKEAQERMRARYMEIWNIIPEHYNDGTPIPIKRISFDNLIYYCNKNNIPISGNIIPDDKTVQLARRMEMYYMMGTIINGNTLKSYTYTEIASQLSKSR